ncbi:hypothetical protein ACHAQJ_002186 [Trichoderma viride]
MNHIKTVVNDTKPRYDNSSPDVPPSHPSYGVSMNNQTIEAIVSTGWSGSRVESITPLAAGKSFNNKIYFLKMQHADEASALGEEDAVLKINGTLYDGDKVQNEVACLRLLELYCPDLPVPRVLAWSEAGASATFVSANHAETKSLVTPVSSSAEKGNNIGWVLTSKVSGKAVNLEELDNATITDLALQLADIVTKWRRSVPPQEHCGSLKIREGNDREANASGDGVALDRPCGPGIPDMAIRGIVVEEIKLPTPIATIQEYYRLKLDNKLKQLESSDAFTRNRHLLDSLKSLYEEKLPRLSFDDMFKQSAIPTNTFQFTHYDLFPRNILVSGSPPRITGIVDFEFSGFFPPIDEFLDDWLDGGDWPEDFYIAYLKRLEENGVATPAKSVKGDSWQMAWWLEKIIENASPWWVLGDSDEGQVKKVLEKAELVIQKMLENFSSV